MSAVAQVRDLTVDIATRVGRNPPVVRALQQVDLRVGAGRVTALIGESGCGKSLLAAALCGLLPPGSALTGHLGFAGTELGGASEDVWRLLRGRRIGLVPQSAATSFTPVRTIGGQLAEVCRRLDADRTPAQLLAAVRLPTHIAACYPHELSGGMAQRAAVAAAIAGRPELLIADEPTSALDPANAGMVWRLLADAATEGAGVLVITHDLPSLLRSGVCDEIAVMRSGTVVHQGPAGEVAGYDDYTRRFFTAAQR